ncbi:MAG: hypothetical protein QHD01_34860 [Bradyrhizobium sp.]|uniref:hypothetical protein n=1 Tax=Bradyrhizobium sp. TaxID=376 RepID=UPI0029A77C30|nr:hypothetical protein [Bradyrhizobium sp.]MDX3971754.1 hypothetical protein [Bradyrhizobium sp.]
MTKASGVHCYDVVDEASLLIRKNQKQGFGFENREIEANIVSVASAVMDHGNAIGAVSLSRRKTDQFSQQAAARVLLPQGPSAYGSGLWRRRSWGIAIFAP